jgi:tRNA(Ile)-lysidine synthase
MLNKFRENLEQHFPSLLQNKHLLAISGGIDSVVLCHMLVAAGVKFALAHVNFALRGKESDADQRFVEALAARLELKIHTQKFDCQAYAEDHKMSIQMAARELRYNYFKTLTQNHSYKKIITAHHAHDQIETFFINLIRGTGIAGLTGMPQENNIVARPLIRFSRKQIETYAKQHHIIWREDKTNASNYYLRNKIRHQISPILEQENPNFLRAFQGTQDKLKQIEQLAEDYVSLIYDKIVRETFSGFEINLNVLNTLPHPDAILYQLLKEFDFSDWDTVYGLRTAQAGKKVTTSAYILHKDRDILLLQKRKEKEIDETESYLLYPDNELVFPLGRLQISKVDKLGGFADTVAYFDAKKLKYPLILRKWQAGDYFYPLGMKGKQKISDFLINNKVALQDKENIYVLCCDKEIIWLVSHRIDERFKVQDKTQKITKITLKS